MKILVVEPEKEPYVKEIENELSDMQKVVGGLIEPITNHAKSTQKTFKLALRA